MQYCCMYERKVPGMFVLSGGLASLLPSNNRKLSFFRVSCHASAARIIVNSKHVTSSQLRYVIPLGFGSMNEDCDHTVIMSLIKKEEKMHK